MYIRFQTSEIDYDSSTKPFWIFHGAYELRDSAIPEYDKQYLKDLLERFDDNLDKPTKFSRKQPTWWATKWISRYKDSAKEHIQKMYEMKRIYEEYDKYVEVVVTDNPWYIVYEDEYQIVAEPYKDTLR